MRTQGIGPRIQPAVGEELPVGMVAHRALDPAAGIEQTYHPESYAAQAQQVLAGHKTDQQGYDLLHGRKDNPPPGAQKGFAG